MRILLICMVFDGKVYGSQGNLGTFKNILCTFIIPIFTFIIRRQNSVEELHYRYALTKSRKRNSDRADLHLAAHFPTLCFHLSFQNLNYQILLRFWKERSKINTVTPGLMQKWTQTAYVVIKGCGCPCPLISK